MTDDPDRIRDAVEQASEEHGLATWYRSCATPLVTMDESRYPSCCGGECEPCNELLVSVAIRARELLRASTEGTGIGALSDAAAPLDHE